MTFPELLKLSVVSLTVVSSIADFIDRVRGKKTPISLGISTNGLNKVIIKRNTELPLFGLRTFTIKVPDTSFETPFIEIIRGERIRANCCVVMGTADLPEVEPSLLRETLIEVTFQLGSKGVLKVTAKNLETGVKRSVTIRGATKIGNGRIAKILANYKKNMETDAKVEYLFLEAMKLSDRADLVYRKIQLNGLEEIKRQKLSLDNLSSIVTSLKINIMELMLSGDIVKMETFLDPIYGQIEIEEARYDFENKNLKK